MRQLPTCVTLRLGGAVCSVIHGGATDLSQFIFASTPARLKAAQAAALLPVPPHPTERAGSCSHAPNVVIAGHSGVPFSQLLEDGTLWHNAGVVGMPANDGTCAWRHSDAKVADRRVSGGRSLTRRPRRYPSTRL